MAASGSYKTIGSTTTVTPAIENGSGYLYVSTQNDALICNTNRTPDIVTTSMSHNSRKGSTHFFSNLMQKRRDHFQTRALQQAGIDHGASYESNSIVPTSDAPICAILRCKSIKTRTSILIISVLIFASILCTSITLIGVVAKSNVRTNRVAAEFLAVETGQFLANELDKATLPLFSLAQFATELDLFNDLPLKIGQAGTAGSLPFINTTFADGRIRRNTTGVCDQPDLVNTFDKIVLTATNRAKLDDVLYNIQFAPGGVICLSSELIPVDFINDDTILNSTTVIGVDLLNTPQLQYFAREALRGESISIDGPRTAVQCPDCGLYFIVIIPILSTTHHIEIDGQEYDRWGFATALIQWEKLVQRSYIYELFSSENKDFRLTRTDHVYNAASNIYDEVIVTLAQSENYETD